MIDATCSGKSCYEGIDRGLDSTYILQFWLLEVPNWTQYKLLRDLWFSQYTEILSRPILLTARVDLHYLRLVQTYTSYLLLVQTYTTCGWGIYIYISKYLVIDAKTSVSIEFLNEF